MKTFLLLSTILILITLFQYSIQHLFSLCNRWTGLIIALAILNYYFIRYSFWISSVLLFILCSFIRWLWLFVFYFIFFTVFSKFLSVF